jgi:hypothetical protein
MPMSPSGRGLPGLGHQCRGHASCRLCRVRMDQSRRTVLLEPNGDKLGNQAFVKGAPGLFAAVDIAKCFHHATMDPSWELAGSPEKPAEKPGRSSQAPCLVRQPSIRDMSSRVLRLSSRWLLEHGPARSQLPWFAWIRRGRAWPSAS